ncbi:hypothetical protein B0F90DRAFT_1920288 [Multifurca ochricompacta]|uniref:Uncharacterized protein n=1 Tax=Multifurca ochricompacta TaxID=376703 RepID=A0AAD4LVY0_9AGAM|nr:hypothetical protein B0F90DRAFT_1920288 [Multifurca ochricompacta]
MIKAQGHMVKGGHMVMWSGGANASQSRLVCRVRFGRDSVRDPMGVKHRDRGTGQGISQGNKEGHQGKVLGTQATGIKKVPRQHTKGIRDQGPKRAGDSGLVKGKGQGWCKGASSVLEMTQFDTRECPQKQELQGSTLSLQFSLSHPGSCWQQLLVIKHQESVFLSHQVVLRKPILLQHRLSSFWSRQFNKQPSGSILSCTKAQATARASGFSTCGVSCRGIIEFRSSTARIVAVSSSLQSSTARKVAVSLGVVLSSAAVDAAASSNVVSSSAADKAAASLGLVSFPQALEWRWRACRVNLVAHWCRLARSSYSLLVRVFVRIFNARRELPRRYWIGIRMRSQKRLRQSTATISSVLQKPRRQHARWGQVFNRRQSSGIIRFGSSTAGEAAVSLDFSSSAADEAAASSGLFDARRELPRYLHVLVLFLRRWSKPKHVFSKTDKLNTRYIFEGRASLARSRQRGGVVRRPRRMFLVDKYVGGTSGSDRVIIVVPSDQGIHTSLPGSSRRRSRQGSSTCEVHDLVGLANCFDDMVRRIVGVRIASSSGVFDNGPEASSLRQGVRPSQGRDVQGFKVLGNMPQAFYLGSASNFLGSGIVIKRSLNVVSQAVFCRGQLSWSSHKSGSLFSWSGEMLVLRVLSVVWGVKTFKWRGSVWVGKGGEIEEKRKEKRCTPRSGYLVQSWSRFHAVIEQILLFLLVSSLCLILLDFLRDDRKGILNGKRGVMQGTSFASVVLVHSGMSIRGFAELYCRRVRWKGGGSYEWGVLRRIQVVDACVVWGGMVGVHGSSATKGCFCSKDFRVFDLERVHCAVNLRNPGDDWPPNSVFHGQLIIMPIQGEEVLPGAKFPEQAYLSVSRVNIGL